jgi:hypothetical protein
MLIGVLTASSVRAYISRLTHLTVFVARVRYARHAECWTSLVPPRRGTKLRAFTVSGEEPKEVASHARPHKPPAKAITARKAAAMKIGGGKMPPKIRKKLEKEKLPVRVRPADPRENDQVERTRYGKREPKARRHDEAAEIRDARPSRRANVPAPDPGTRRDKMARLGTRHPR